MSLPVMNTVVASRDFVVDASMERVWRLIGKAILSSLPGMEEMEILDENNFRATLKVKVSLLEFKMKLRGKLRIWCRQTPLRSTLALQVWEGISE
jgi:carbon monoxide dehydrogenase subunit G